MRKFLTLGIFLLVAGGVNATTRYIKTNGTTSAANAANATTWAAACNDLQAVISASTAGDTIFVAAGTYNPNRPANNLTTISATSRENAFVLKEGVKMYGGFPANANDVTHTSIPTRGQAPLLNATILSGDIGTANVNSDNCYHVVIGASITAATVLDGFTITGGNANGGTYINVNGISIYREYGGGIYNRNSSPTLTNLIFSGNTAIQGGGIYNTTSSSPSFTNVTISGNTATSYGGGIANNSSTPTLTNVTVSGNTATSGGGIYNTSSSSPAFTNVTISGNSATSYGGGIYSLHDGQSTPAGSYTNCLFAGNTASTGGAFYYDDGNGAGTVFTNCTFAADNTSPNGAVFAYYKDNSSAAPQFLNCIIDSATSGNLFYNANAASINDIIFKNTLTKYSSLGTNAANANNILNTDPLFTNAGSGDYTLQPTSPAIGAGDNTLYTGGAAALATATDLAGNARLYGTNIDMGAYENQTPAPVLSDLQYTALPTSVIYDGSAHAITVTAQTGVTGLGAITVKYDGSTTAPTNVGTYAISVSIAIGTVYLATTTDLMLGNLTIVPDTVAVVWSDTIFVYNGTAQKPTATADTLAVSVSGAQTNAGTGYTATVSTTDTNYYLSNTSVRFKIVPDTIAVVWSNTVFVYNGTAQKPTATANTLVVSVSGAQTNVGTGYTANATTANSNYYLTNAAVLFRIVPDTVAVVWSDTVLVYNGTAQKPTATANTVVVSVSGAQTNAGTGYTATASTANANYYLTNTVVQFRIVPDTIAVVWSDTTFVYDGLPHLPTAIAGTLYLTVSTSQTDVGTYQATASSDNTNYHLTNTTFDWSIMPSVMVTTLAVTTVSQTTAVLHGKIVHGNAVVTSGFEYKETTASNYTSVMVTLTDDSVLTHTLTGLMPNTNYQYRGFAIYNGNTIYGDVETFMTQNVGIANSTAIETSIKIYPNPVEDILHIQSSATIEQATIYDLSGRIVRQVQMTNDIPVQDLARGVYVIKIETKNGIEVGKIAKE